MRDRIAGNGRKAISFYTSKTHSNNHAMNYATDGAVIIPFFYLFYFIAVKTNVMLHT